VIDQFLKYHKTIMLGDLNRKFETRHFQTNTSERESTYEVVMIMIMVLE
jgi:hypothetical protein